MALSNSFRPARALRGPHRQTVWSNYAPRNRAGPDDHDTHTTSVATLDDDRIRAHWWKHPDPTPVLIVLHGLTGCAVSPNVLGVARKALERGFSVLRVDLRNASGDTPSLGVGHAGRSEDLRTLIAHVRMTAPGCPMAVVGFSLGGNVSLKAVGEYGATPPPELRAVATISVPIDLDSACHRIDPVTNWPYRHYFLRRLGHTVERRMRRAPSVYADIELRGTRTLRGFDNAVVAPVCGFRNAEHYYEACSAIRFVADIRLPTLLIQAQDDPFVPFASYEDRRLTGNGSIRLLAPSHGRHTGFYAADSGSDPDPYWAENRAIDHCARHVGLEP